MGFLAPLYLLLGAGAAVPLLVHLMRRRSGLRVPFPAVRYLARAEQEHSRQLRIRNLLLMLLRVAAVVLIAFAAARPVSGALGALFGVGHAPTAVAIVLDNSLSTSAIDAGHPVLDGLSDVARTAVGHAGPSDRVWLVTADGRVQGGTRAAIVSAIARTEPLAGAGDLPHAVTTAASLVRSSGLPNGVVAIVTDGQGAAWAATGGGGGGRTVDVGAARAVLFAPNTPPPANHAVTNVDVHPMRWTPRGEITATVTGASDSAAYRITLGGRALARGTVANGQISVHAAPADRGWVAGTVELEPDELRGDDVRHFAVWIGDPPVVDEDSSVGPFARGAVDALVAGGRATRAGPGEHIGIVSADNLRSLPALIVAPLDPVRVGAANRALERAGVPWRLGAPRSNLRYPLELMGGAAADTVRREGEGNGDTPWVVAGPGYVLIASPLDPRATTLPLRAGFVPWIGELLTQRLQASGIRDQRSGAGSAIIAAAPGATVHRPPWAAELEAPDGARRTLSGATIAVPAKPGVYFLRRTAGERIGALTVNGEATESDLTRLPAEGLASRVRAQGGRRGAAVYSDGGQWAAAVFDATAGRPLAAPLLGLALALLIIETLVVRASAAGRERSVTGGRRAAARRAPSRRAA